MVEPVSPLGEAYTPGKFANDNGDITVTLGEMRPGSIVQVAAFAGKSTALARAVKTACGLTLAKKPGGGVVSETQSVFGIAPGRFLIIDQAEGLGETLRAAIDDKTGAVTDLSHGRTAIRVTGKRARWVLSQFFAVDFSARALAPGSGVSTAHHEIFAQVQRVGDDSFDVYVFRSFARSFWKDLCRAAEESGYEIS